jgi:F-type H+-transporting ATPase subunit delta
MNTTRRAKRSARQLFRLCVVNGVLDETRVRLVARRLAASGRRGALLILSGFHRLVRLDRERHTALVESAAPLPDALRQTVASGLTRKYGADVTTTFEQAPALIGGMRIKVGSDVYDGSVRARLDALRARL